MFIDFNKKKLKMAGAGFLAAALLVGAGTGYMVSRPEKSHDVQDAVTLADTGTTNWGLSFQEEGKTPVGNATSEKLKDYDAYYCGDSDKKIIYLTFDAGYENGYTAQILDVLKKEKVPAAFFLVGTYMETNPDLVKRMADEGHIVGNHTMNHPDMSAIADETAFKTELEGVETRYKDITGKDMKKYYRPPQGKFSFTNLEQAKKLGYETVFWSLAYVDWYVDKQPSREEAMAKLIPRNHNGAVILLHSTSKTNAQILQELITKWKEEGYKFKSIEELGK